MHENVAELQRQVLALLTTMKSDSARYRLCEIHEQLTELLRVPDEHAPDEPPPDVAPRGD